MSYNPAFPSECQSCTTVPCKKEGCLVYRAHNLKRSPFYDDDAAEYNSFGIAGYLPSPKAPEPEVEYTSPVTEREVSTTTIRAFVEVEEKPRLKLPVKDRGAMQYSDGSERYCSKCSSLMTGEVGYYFNGKPIPRWKCSNKKCGHSYLEHYPGAPE